MFSFGIEGYEPQWVRGGSAVAAAHGDRLGQLVQRRLSGGWVVWDLQDDEWFSDCPVLLDFEGHQVELNHHKLDDLSITWNTVDPATPVAWPGFALRWRRDGHPGLRSLEGQVLQDIEILEWTGDDLAHGTVAVSFVFPEARLTVFNALDENGLTLEPPDPRYRRHPLR